MGPIGKALCVLTILALCGCLSGAVPLAPTSTNVPVAAERPVVVALIDSGVELYHDAFRSGATGPTALDLARTVPNSTLIDPAVTGNYDERWNQDAPLRDSIVTSHLYLVNNTRLGYVMMDSNRSAIMYDLFGHGTKTSFEVVNTSSHVLVVMLQTNMHSCDPAISCYTSDNPALALKWAAEQPWIDVIGMSFGTRFGEPTPGSNYREMPLFHDALLLAARNGKVLVSAVTDAATPNVADFVSGPPEVIAVGGAEDISHTWAANSGLNPDFVGNFTVVGPQGGTTSRYGNTWGTSFAAPVVAGTIGEAIHILREQGTPYDAAKLRRALNASAIQWAPTDYHPLVSPSNDSQQLLHSPPAPHIVPGAQMGWGYVDGSLAPEIARRVTENDYAPKADIATQQAMTAYQAAREAYWANGGP